MKIWQGETQMNGKKGHAQTRQICQLTYRDYKMFQRQHKWRSMTDQPLMCRPVSQSEETMVPPYALMPHVVVQGPPTHQCVTDPGSRGERTVLYSFLRAHRIWQDIQHRTSTTRQQRVPSSEIWLIPCHELEGGTVHFSAIGLYSFYKVHQKLFYPLSMVGSILELSRELEGLSFFHFWTQTQLSTGVVIRV